MVGVAFLVFLALRLAGVIHWSWWWVTSPLWLSALAVASVPVVGGVAFVIHRLARNVRGSRAS
jgi:hypothetical protein